jgi:hypothetical protein
LQVDRHSFPSRFPSVFLNSLHDLGLRGEIW